MWKFITKNEGDKVRLGNKKEAGASFQNTICVYKN